MKLYMHPVSTTSRPIVMFCADHDIALEQEVVDLATGAHHQPPYADLNPNKQVPLLVDGDFQLTESSAILKYIAEKHDLPAYPKGLQERARVNELMDWFNTGFYRDLGYNLVYPQVYDHHKRPGPINEGTVRWGKEKVAHWLGVLERHILGHGGPWLAGEQRTIADYFGANLLACGDLIGNDLSDYPNVSAWLDRARALPSWGACSEAHDGFVRYLSSNTFEHVGA